jgi:hypothetical protein
MIAVCEITNSLKYFHEFPRTLKDFLRFTNRTRFDIHI